MLITFGFIAAFFLFTVVILQLTFKRDRDFSDFAVGGRSFGGAYQAMSFLNTWYPGAIFIAFASLTVASGVVGFYLLSYSLLTIVVMYLMARRVWIWGKVFDLRTQPDLFALRFDSKRIRPVAGFIGVVTLFPWLVLGLQALGLVFQYLSLHTLTYTQAVFIGVGIMLVRQYWTVKMGMRGVVISDMIQGIVAYGLGTIMILGLILWLYARKHVGFSEVEPRLFDIPGLGSPEGPLYLFSLVFTGAIGGWCWPSIFVRLFTADGVRSMKKAAAIAVPLSLVFCVSLLVLCLLASALPDVAANPNDVWFIVSQDAGGIPLLGAAGVVVFAATVGNVAGTIQASGTQIANDLIGHVVKLPPDRLVTVSKLGMLTYMLLAAWVACGKLPALFTLAVIAYQGVIQLAVPQFLGIFWKRGNSIGAVAGLSIGFALACVLELRWPAFIPFLGGLSSGIAALVANLLIYVGFACLMPRSEVERRRVDELFAMTRVGATQEPLAVQSEQVARRVATSKASYPAT